MDQQLISLVNKVSSSFHIHSIVIRAGADSSQLQDVFTSIGVSNNIVSSVALCPGICSEM